MAGWTNRGKALVLGHVFNPAVTATTPPTNFFAALCTDATTPTVDTNKIGDLTEVTAGTGYTQGGTSLAKNATDFPTYTEDDTSDFGSIKIKNLTWTASGGSISNAKWLVLTGDQDAAGASATAASGNRVVYAWFDLGSVFTITSGQTLAVNGSETRATE